MKRLNTEAVLDRLGIKSRETLRQLVLKKILPPPVRDEGSTIKFWFEDDIDAYLKKQADTRDQAARSNQAEQPKQLAAA